MNDPEIARLASMGGKSVETLYYQIYRHLNSGKRTKKLRPWDPSLLPPAPIVAHDDDEQEEDDDAA